MCVSECECVVSSVVCQSVCGHSVVVVDSCAQHYTHNPAARPASAARSYISPAPHSHSRPITQHGTTHIRACLRLRRCVWRSDDAAAARFVPNQSRGQLFLLINIVTKFETRAFSFVYFRPLDQKSTFRPFLFASF